MFNFDRGKPFYPIIMAYVFKQAGIKEACLLGLCGYRDVTASLAQAKALGNEATYEQLAKLIGPLKLKLSLGEPLDVNLEMIGKELINNHEYLFRKYIEAEGSLLIDAYEKSKNKPWRTRSPLWEFLRHCRNAAGHGGRFNFFAEEPRFPAMWDRFEIVENMQGTPLFKNGNGDGLLSIGDPIKLLWDIEQACPEMTVDLDDH